MADEEHGAGETGRATIRQSHPRFGSAGATTGPTCVSQEANPEPAAARGEVEAGGDVEAGERAEEAGYDSTLLVVIGILDDIKEQSNVAGRIHASGLWGPLTHLHTSLVIRLATGSRSAAHGASLVPVLFTPNPGPGPAQSPHEQRHSHAH